MIVSNPEVERLLEAAKQIFGNFTAEDAECMLRNSGPPTDHVLKFLNLMRQILQIDPDEKSALSNIAEIVGRFGYLEEAQQAAERLVRIEPSRHTYLRFGQSLNGTRNYKKAAEVLEKALSFVSRVDSRGHPDEWDVFGVWVQLAVAKANIGYLQEALNCVENGIKVAPTDDTRHSAIALRSQIQASLDRIHGGSR